MRFSLELILVFLWYWLMVVVVCFIHQVAQLVEDNRRLQATISKLRDTTSSQTARLEEELTSKTRSVEILQEKLAAQTDYDEIKRELGLVEFSLTRRCSERVIITNFPKFKDVTSL